MKILKCEDCGIELIFLEKGSKIRTDKGYVLRCGKCNYELLLKSQKKEDNIDNIFNQMFGGFRK